MQDSNIPLKKMTRERYSNSVRQPRAFARVLSFLLLGFIVYGTTIEAAHRHSALRASESSHSTSLSNTGTRDALTGGLTGCSDCLICQLHQDFSQEAVAGRQHNPPTKLQVRFSQAHPSTFRSQINAPRSGRAPPFIS
jgi:hypothetical protein